MKRISLVILIQLTLAMALAGCATFPGAPAGSSFIEESFTVEPGQKHTVAVLLQERRIVGGTFSVSGERASIDFYVTGPEGELVYGVERAVGGHSFEIRAQNTGTYTLYFDNSISGGSPRQVSLRYRVR
ncbi:MAG: emp24/gp25L/p24 family protein [Dehalococcoidales bacterium]|nr:emp24/gp25L/p24 family protein [Dehalococcoidales bacterium]